MGESQQVVAVQVSWKRREGDKEREKERHNKTISFHECTGNNKHSLLHCREPTLQYPPVSFCQLKKKRKMSDGEAST